MTQNHFSIHYLNNTHRERERFLTRLTLTLLNKYAKQNRQMDLMLFNDLILIYYVGTNEDSLQYHVLVS